MNVQEAMEAVKDGTFKEKLMVKKIAKEYMRKATKSDPNSSTGGIARGRALYEAKHPAVNTNEEEI